MNIYDQKMFKNGEELKKVHLLYIDGDKKSCDGCDEKKACASVCDLIGNVMVICKDCLMDIVNEFT